MMLQETILVLLVTISLFSEQVFSSELVSPDQLVECYTSTSTSLTTDCSEGSIGTLRADECCAGNGNTFTLMNQCLGCFLIGFNQSKLEFTADEASQVKILYLVSQKLVTNDQNLFVNFIVNSVNFSRETPVEINEFVLVFPRGDSQRLPTTPFELPYEVMTSSTGNSVALEDPLNFSVTVMLDPLFMLLFPRGDIGLIFFNDRVDVTVADLDVIVFNFESPDGTMFTEGDEGGVIVQRNSVQPSRPVTVYVRAQRLSDIQSLKENQYPATNADFKYNETEKYTFVADGDSRIQRLFSAEEDDIVEQGDEVFEVELYSNEPLVQINVDSSVQRLFIIDDDEFQIGFKRTKIVVREGNIVQLTIEQTNDNIGEVRGNNTLLDTPRINNVKASAVVDQDYNFTDSEVPQMEINTVNGRLNSISFVIGTIFNDNVLEGRETFFVRVSQRGILQVGDNASTTIDIIDGTAATIRLMKKVYYVNESDFVIDICAEIVGPDSVVINQPLTINFIQNDVTATNVADYFIPTSSFIFSFSTSCVMFFPIPDIIRESLFENATIRLMPYTGNDFSNLSVDETPSDIVIIDDDRYVIFFEREFVAFSESSGNQEIFVQFGGGTLQRDFVAIIYDADSGIEVDRVTFSRSGPERSSFIFNVNDNDIALEPNKTRRIFINETNEYGLMNPSEMTIVIYDDDVVSVDFVSPNYNYIEAHGNVTNIQVEISTAIAENLFISIAGSPGQQASSVIVSGVSYSSMIEFAANTPAQTRVVIPSFMINDDEVGLESLEQYQLTFTGSSNAMNVNLGQPTNISIADDDGVIVSFASNEYLFSEGDGNVYVQVVLNRPIASNLMLRIRGMTAPLLPGVSDSGSDVDEIITFTAQDNQTANVFFNITDDIVTGEPIQQYNLTLVQAQPSNVMLGPFPSTTISISDNDVSVVRFIPFMGPLMESAGSYNLTVELAGQISSSVSVTILDNDGNVVRVITFQPIQGLPTQQAVVTITFMDDNIALEEEERLVYFLSNPMGTTIAMPSTAEVIITDDDVVSVEFVSLQYNYSEDQLTVSNIQVQISHEIAQELEVFYFGEPSLQNGVITSGVPVLSSVIFSPGSVAMSLEAIEEFNITDDEVALELDEQYPIAFINSSVSDYIILGPQTTITIMDNDIVEVDFELPSYSFSEASGFSNDISLMLSAPIAQQLSLTVAGGPGDDQDSSVAVSGTDVQFRITFPPGQSPVMLQSFMINNDNTSLETDEEYELFFINPSPSDGVILGSSANITIVDDDSVTISFSQPSFTYSESDGQTYSSIAVHLSGPIAQDLTVHVFGSPINQLSSVKVSGFSVDTSVLFMAFSNLTKALSSFVISDDNFALETLEFYDIMLQNPSSEKTILGNPSRINIIDDDVVTLTFGNETYSFTENDQGIITVQLSTDVSQDVIVTVNGAPGIIPNILISGSPINEQVMFAAGGVRTSEFMFDIIDDEVALESLESYMITMTVMSPSPSGPNLIVGNPATIEILSDDVVEVLFGTDNTFSEEDDSDFIPVSINNAIARDLTVYIFGESMPTAGVFVSGVTVNTSVTFQPSTPMSLQFPIFITDDNVALENDEVYDLSFIGSSSPTGVILGPKTQVIIQDFDMVTVNFQQNLYSFSEGADQSYGINLVLTNPIANDLLVSVFADPGQQPNTVEISGFSANVTITFMSFSNLSSLPSFSIFDDEIGLEITESYAIRLVSSDPSVNLGGDSTIEIIDDDVPIISFPDNFTFTEGVSPASIQLNIDRVIYQDISVTIFGESSQQFAVVNNGPDINSTLMFSARGNSSVFFNLVLTDDFVSRENDEVYVVSLLSSTLPADISATTLITIIDNDMAEIGFTSTQYLFMEGDGLTMQVMVALNGLVARDFTVRVFGDTTPLANGVIDSGTTVDEYLTFDSFNSTQENLMQIVSVLIIDDNVSGEPNQLYSLELQDVPLDVQVIQNVTTIIIDDDDQSGVRFQPFTGPLYESSGIYNVTVILNGEISSPASVDVVGQDGSIITTVTFTPIPGLMIQEQTVTITFVDDEIALEDDEVIKLFLNNTMGTTAVNPSEIDVIVTDDDDVTVEFVSLMYNYSESHGEVMNIQVQLSKTIENNFTVFITGNPNQQLSTVIVSGALYFSPVNFPANTPARTPIFIQSFMIKNDETARETLEQYQLQFTMSSRNMNVNLGQPTTIFITDDDVVSVGFEKPEEFFQEGSGEQEIYVMIDRGVATNFTIVVSGVTTPLAPRVADSGSNVNETITFYPQGPLTMEVNVTITDDDVSREPVQTYELSIDQQPSDVMIAPFSTFSVNIVDNDQANVRFSPFTGPLLESMGAYNLTVVLDGEISSHVFVAVLDASGNLIQNVTFEPVQGAAVQEIDVQITFSDDNIALEENEELQFVLSNPIGAQISGSSLIDVIVMDDDEVTVSFVNNTYSFMEGDVGRIEIQLSNQIAQNLTVLVNGISDQQPFVVNNGPIINSKVTFDSDGSSIISIPVTVQNDFYGLENIESYLINIQNSSIPNVNVGRPAVIMITDNDVVTVQFVSDRNNYSENDGRQNISVVIDIPIARNLVVNVFGESVDAPGVVLSGGVVNTSIVFPMGMSSSQNFFIDITDDITGLENNEEFEIGFTQSNPSAGVVLGTNTAVMITDDDSVTVSFLRPTYYFNETDGSGTVRLVVNRPVAKNFSVEVIGRTMDNPVVTSSVMNVNTTVSFIAAGSNVYDFPIHLFDDENALEDTETLMLQLENPNPDSIISTSMTNIMIIDDDVVTVSFARSNYVVQENELTAEVGIVIDKTIRKSLNVSVFGESTPVNGVFQSGETVDTVLTFQAEAQLFLLFPIGINDDLVGLENPESYPLQITSSSPSDKVELGPDTFVTIIDNDVVSVQFEKMLYSFFENEGVVSITLILSRQISQEFSVNVFGEPVSSPLVTVSGPYINETVTFVPGGSTTFNVTFTLRDDADGLENIESFTVSLNNPSMQNVDVSATTNVEILDDDIVEVMFVPVTDPVREDAGSQTIMAEINRNILGNLTVSVVGESPRQSGVTNSGQPVSVDVLFEAGPSRFSPIVIEITNDMDALENDELYNLMFTNSIPSRNVQLGMNTFFRIEDDDNVTVSFSQSIYQVSENESSLTVMLRIDRTIQTPFFVDVIGDPAPQPRSVVISGTEVNERNLIFNESINNHIFTVRINDDQVSLEDLEEYFLSIVSSSVDNVFVGESALIRITDDDALSYGVSTNVNTSFIYPENVPHQVFMLTISPSIKNLTFSVTDELKMDRYIVSLQSLNCDGMNRFGTFTVPPSLEERTVNCSVEILDDNIVNEDDEVHRLSITLVDPDQNTIPVVPRVTRVDLIVADNDVAEVVTDVVRKNVTEGGDVLACVAILHESLTNVSVVLETVDGSAKSGDDFAVSGERMVLIPAGSTDFHCVSYSTFMDTDFEGNEEFDVIIHSVSISGRIPSQRTPKPPAIGSQNSTTILIVDVPPDSRSCRFNSLMQVISTFGGSNAYAYNRTCEHALLLQQTPIGEFGVFIESLDGTFQTTRVGVRIGSSESIVINAYNRTIIRQTNLNQTRISSTLSRLTISVPALNFLLEISSDGVTIFVESNSVLQGHRGLCGDLNGNLILRNGSTVDISDDYSLNKVINQNLVPPSETFIRMAVRQECGLTGEDLETGDPMYVVPLYTPRKEIPHSYSLCYEIHGYKDQNYNLISDECTQVYGHYYEANDPDPDSVRKFHGINRIEVSAVNNVGQCVSITVSLSNNMCSTSVGNSLLTETYSSFGLSVRQTANRTRISVPNCADSRLVMNVMCRGLETSVPYLELRVVRGLNLRETSHGLIGQFWNVETRVTKYNETLRDGTVRDNAYLVELMPSNREKRSFIGFLYSRTWNFDDFPCIYAGNAQGGPIYEAADGEPNDSVIEGFIEEYSEPIFPYNQFHSERC